jgi:hypothetical protein
MFDPSTARWMSEDPASFRAGDADLYRYVGNSPTNATDPSGLDEHPLKLTNKSPLIGFFNGDSGTWDYDIRSTLQWWGKSPGAEVHFTFKPYSLTANDQVFFIQVVTQSIAKTDSGAIEPRWPGKKDGGEDYFKRFATDPGKANRLDHLKGGITPFYNADLNGNKVRRSRQNWVSSEVGTIGRGGDNPIPATMDDAPGHSIGLYHDIMMDMQFETAAFLWNTGDVLGVIRWGWHAEKKADGTWAVQLYEPQVSETPSAEFRGLVDKWNHQPEAKVKVAEPAAGGATGISALPPK